MIFITMSKTGQHSGNHKNNADAWLWLSILHYQFCNRKEAVPSFTRAVLFAIFTAKNTCHLQTGGVFCNNCIRFTLSLLSTFAPSKQNNHESRTNLYRMFSSRSLLHRI